MPATGEWEAKGVPIVGPAGLAAFFRGKIRLFWLTLQCLQQNLSSKRCQPGVELSAGFGCLKELSVRVTTTARQVSLGRGRGNGDAKDRA